MIVQWWVRYSNAAGEIIEIFPLPVGENPRPGRYDCVDFSTRERAEAWAVTMRQYWQAKQEAWVSEGL